MDSTPAGGPRKWDMKNLHELRTFGRAVVAEFPEFRKTPEFKGLARATVVLTVLGASALGSGQWLFSDWPKASPATHAAMHGGAPVEGAFIRAFEGDAAVDAAIGHPDRIQALASDAFAKAKQTHLGKTETAIDHLKKRFM